MLRTKSLWILCSGLDEITRGFETYAREVYSAFLIEGENVQLLKRSGSATTGEFCTHTPSRNSFLCKILSLMRGTPYYWEHLFFALWALFKIRRLAPSNDLVLFMVEPTVARAFHKFKGWGLIRCRTVFSHSVWMEPQDYVPYSDRILEASIENFEKSYKYLGCKNKVQLVPFFKNDDPIFPSYSKTDFIQKYQMQFDRIVLGVGILDREHKRAQCVIQSLCNLPTNWGLLWCGQVKDLSLLQEAKKSLGSRFVQVHVNPKDMPEIYACSDVFVHAALLEGFGMVFLEAMRAGLPLLAHNGPLFQWIIQDSDQVVDMRHQEALNEKLLQFANDEARRKSKGQRNRNHFLQNFSWDAQKNKYRAAILGED